MWQYIIPALATVTVAVIEAIAAKGRKQTKEQIEKAEKRSERRMKENQLSMQMMYATLQLSVVTANALTGGHNNGNVEKARQAAQEAQERYEEFLAAVAIEELNKK